MVAQQAVSRLDLPQLPIAMSPPGTQLVGVPTWLWIDSTTWTTRSASASVGAVTATATATPSRVVWSTGDGAQVTCTGPGTPWQQGTDPAAPSPTCGHVYRRASTTAAGGAFPVTATVSWSIAWSGAGQAGALPALTTSATTSTRVDEVRAVVVTG